MLAWLALHPGPHARAALAGRFWPDNLDARARAGLRNALWALRRAAGAELLDASRDRVGLHPAVWVDTAAFAEHVRGGRYAEAVALHRGELLSGIEEEWVHDAREAHRRQLGAAFEALAAGAEDAGDRRAAIRLTRRRAELDPLDEAAHAALITRLAAAGDTVDALVCFERHREALRRELGIAPSHTTQEAVRRLRAVPEPAPQRAPSAEDEPSWRPGLRFPLPPRLRLRHAAPFVGRATELTVLRQAWRDVVDGAGPLVAVVDGEAGIGKSRLAREFALRTRDAAPAVVLQGTAQEEAIASLRPVRGGRRPPRAGDGAGRARTRARRPRGRPGADAARPARRTARRGPGPQRAPLPDARRGGRAPRGRVPPRAGAADPRRPARGRRRHHHLAPARRGVAPRGPAAGGGGVPRGRVCRTAARSARCCTGWTAVTCCGASRSGASPTPTPRPSRRASSAAACPPSCSRPCTGKPTATRSSSRSCCATSSRPDPPACSRSRGRRCPPPPARSSAAAWPSSTTTACGC